MDRNRKLAALGASLWILGLILFILGLNLPNTAGRWMTVLGSVSFLLGLGLEGVWWLRSRKTQDLEARERSEKEPSEGMKP